MLSVVCLLVAVEFLHAEEAYQFGKYQADGKDSPAFVIKYRGKSCLIAPRDMMGAVKGQKFSTAAGKALAIGHTLEQRYLSVHILKSSQVKEDLSYVPDLELKVGDEIFSVGPNGKKDEGKLLFNQANGPAYTSDMGSVVLTVLTEDKTGKTRLPSGCPVFLKRTGQLLGVVVVGRSVREPYEYFEHPEYFKFQTLCLPATTKQKPKMMDTIAGVPFNKPVELDSYRWLMPTLAFQLKLGMNKEDRAKVLVDKKGGVISYRDHTYSVRDDAPFLATMRLDSGPRGTALKMVTFSGHTNPEIGRFYKVEKLLKSLTESYGPPSLYTDTYTPGSDSQNARMIMHWMIGEQSITLHLHYGVLQMHGYLHVSSERSNPFIKGVAKKHRLGKPPADLNKAYFSWLGRVYKWRKLPSE